MKVLFLILFFLLWINEYTARVVGVTDGDTIIVLTAENKQVKIRLEGIDCPESKQEFGNVAKQTTVNLCFGKNVVIVPTGIDKYGRTLAFVYIGDTCVNKFLLETGMAWHYKKYNNDPELAKRENKARERKVGLWSQSVPIPPWEWRKK